MIPEIGIMIGTYIITRILFLLREPNATKGTGGVIVTTFAVVTMLVTAFVILDLLAGGMTATSGLSY